VEGTICMRSISSKLGYPIECREMHKVLAFAFWWQSHQNGVQSTQQYSIKIKLPTLEPYTNSIYKYYIYTLSKFSRLTYNILNLVFFLVSAPKFVSHENIDN
jgi:hypothetical protein